VLAALPYLVAGGAAFAAGVVNAVAGGGTLISFPTLVALGVSTVSSNVTNTVALCPGYFGGTLAQRADLREQRERIPWLVAVAALGGLAGSILLVHTSDALFRGIVPYLILFACLLLGFQEPIKRRIVRRDAADAEAESRRPPVALLLAAGGGAVYGGYFGAGLGMMLLAALGFALPGTLNKLNAVKQLLSLVINVVAALFFVFSGKVVWPYVAVMAAGSLLGGNLGGRIASRINPRILRAVVVVLGLAVAVKFLAG
jgi:uncharacterized protein